VKVLALFSLVVTLQVPLAHQPISHDISETDYEIYSTWLSQFVQQNAESAIFLSNQTLPFNPLTFPCHKPDTSDPQSHDVYIYEKLIDLGSETFPLEWAKVIGRSRIPSALTVVHEMPAGMTGNYLQFSRIAFSDDGRGGVFAIQLGKTDRSKNVKVYEVWAHKVDEVWKVIALC
jgi:hypothetical protein